MMDEFAFLGSKGQSAEEIRNFCWKHSALGETSSWPLPLKTALQMMLSSRFPKAIVWGPDYITFFNDAFRPILGSKQNCMGKSFKDIWAEAWNDISSIVEKAYAGEATFIEDFPLSINRDGYPEQCYFTFCYSPIRLENGEIGGMIDTVIETTGKVESEQRALIFNSELAHRIKNTFSILSSIANQTFVDADTEQRHKFSERLNALSHAHEVLRLQNSTRSLLSVMIESISTALGVEDRVHISGPDIHVGSKGVASISLLIHELTTNAIKYGSLSKAGGQVDVSLSTSNEGGTDILTLNWRERGGPEVLPPTRKGFGTKLIKTGLLGTGDVILRFEPTGLDAEMKASLHQLKADIARK